jgi:hypothetical protein
MLKAEFCGGGRSVADTREGNSCEDQSLYPTEPRFVVVPFDVALPPGATFDNVEELLDRLEGPMRR